MKIYLRKVKKIDSRFIFNLKISREVLNTSINKEKIKFKSHTSWLKNKLIKKRNLFFIICEKKGDIKVGYVRLDYEDFYFRVTIAIKKEKTRLNYAFFALKNIEKKISLPSILFAQVLSKNIKSIKLFKKSNYTEIGSNKKIKYFLKFITK